MTADSAPTPTGRLVTEDGSEWYRIDHCDLLDPFLVNVVTPHDQWMFVSSSGALTAGRRSAEQALFPYETDDRLHRSGGRTGPLTLMRVGGGSGAWEPFAAHAPLGGVRRSLARAVEGDRLRFEERNESLGLTFRYTWSAAPEVGFVRSCELVRHDGLPPVEVCLLDGLLDLLPAGVELAVQQSASSLVDAYRRCEYDPSTGIALFTLEALVSDRADPAESLRASLAWSHGLDDALGDPVVALSDRQMRRFRSGERLAPEHLLTGRKGAFLVSATVTADACTPVRWITVADVAADHARVSRLQRWLAAADDPGREVASAAAAARDELVRLAAAADGVQETGDRRAAVHHFANTLYNCMRGGVFTDDHRVGVADVARFVASRNRRAAARFERLAGELAPVAELGELRRAAGADADLARLISEYLPLTFSRRHGDPSRPWNRFLIGAEAEGANPAYEGNWRDIFQNWEVLAHSFPGYAPSVVAKFLNASTLDGHNPYRMTGEGVDWEVPEPGSWSNFGYWGDHQIVYLHRLAEVADRHDPDLLAGLLGHEGFSYADSPYRIKPYDEIVRDPKHTIEFDHDLHGEIETRTESVGSDGKLVMTDDEQVHHASLAEKLLVPALAKLSNLVPLGGIWLNTQRPEWNDANNALAGFGVSVVTVFHLRDYLAFVDGLLARAPVASVPISPAVAEWLRELSAAFDSHRDVLNGVMPDSAAADDNGGARGLAPGSVSDPHRGSRVVTGPSSDGIARRRLLDRLGRAFETYRDAVYRKAPAAAAPLDVAELRRLLAAARPHLDAVVAGARRSDGLVDAYRVLKLADGAVDVEPLYLMLEGQVSLLGASDTDAESAVRIVDALFASPLYRADQQSFVLHPAAPRPSFLQKNRIPEDRVGPAVTALIEADTPVVQRDAHGNARFGPGMSNAADLAAALDALEPSLRLSPAERGDVLDAYEAVFSHHAFTGRAQTMYRYEGIGCIYWHMVAKLLVALQQRIAAALDADPGDPAVDELIERYRRVRAGLGWLKPVRLHGAFPLEPYSHTPADAGAQQPGMTGTSKESVLLRWGELGVSVSGGCVQFRPVLLEPGEFLTEPRPWPPLGDGQRLEAGTLGFAYCGVPVVYRLVEGEPWLRVTTASGTAAVAGSRLDRAASAALFARSGQIARIDAGVRLRATDSGEVPSWRR